MASEPYFEHAWLRALLTIYHKNNIVHLLYVFGGGFLLLFNILREHLLFL